MSLNIKSTKLFNEIRKTPSSKVKSPDDNKVEFEDVLEKERGQNQKFKQDHERSEDSHDSYEKHESGHNPAIKNYIKQGDQKHRNSKLMHAKDVYSRPVHSVTPQTTIKEALELMEKYRFHHLPILNDKKMVIGIISDRDIVGKRSQEKVERHMNREVKTAKESTEVTLLAREMIRHGIGCLPILNQEEKLVGIVTKTDLLECLARTMPLDQYI